jgi:hypothetical protein
MQGMAYHHVRLSVKDQKRDEVKTDLDEAQLHRQFLEPYRRGRSITVNGRSVQPDQIERLMISRSVDPSAQIADVLRAEDRASSVAVIGGPSMSWRVARRAADVTDELVLGPPGYESEDPGKLSDQDAETPGPGPTPATAEVRDRVFLVEGRDKKMGKALKELLRCLGLHVIEWEQAVAATGDPNPFIDDIVLAGFRIAHGAVVLFTGDDEVRLREGLLHNDDGPDEREMRVQPRPNVIYEAGLARALFPTRTVIIEIGSPKGFSDKSGRHVVRFDGSASARRRLLNRLEIAGFEIDDSGEEWLTAGDFGDGGPSDD